MIRAMDGRGWVVALVCVLLAGCRQVVVAPYPNYAGEPRRSTIEGKNAFDDYVSAAEQAESKAQKYLTRTHFTPGQKDRVLELLAEPLAKIAQAGQANCGFRFTATAPFESRPSRSGWRLLGLAWRWRIEEAVREERYDAAIQACVLATRFGFDLTGGDCSDASLGYSIVDESRLAMLPALPHLTSNQLRNLAKGLESGLSRAPKLEIAIENERSNMLAAVDSVQNAYKSRDFRVFRIELRQDVQPAIKYLEAIDPADPQRAKYFDSMAKEVDAVCDEAVQKSRLNAKQRSERKAYKLDKSRPWRRWSKYFFQAPNSLFGVRDRTLASTRLFGLHCLLKAETRSGTAPPAELAKWGAPWTIDPYSGKPFVYARTGTSYTLHSVGADFRDDGGETDESFTSPDLTLETRDL